MSCLFNNGYSKANNCLEDNLAGVTEWYIANYSGTTSWSADADNIITGVTNGPTTWFKIEQYDEQGLHTNTHAQSETGQNVWTQGVEMVFFKNTSEVRDLVRVMTQTESIVIGLKNTGQYVLIGEKGLRGKDADASSGKAMEDFNGTRINLGGKQGYEAREISSSFFGTLNVA